MSTKWKVIIDCTKISKSCLTQGHFFPFQFHFLLWFRKFYQQINQEWKKTIIFNWKNLSYTTIFEREKWRRRGRRRRQRWWRRRNSREKFKKRNGIAEDFDKLLDRHCPCIQKFSNRRIANAHTQYLYSRRRIESIASKHTCVFVRCEIVKCRYIQIEIYTYTLHI